MHTQPNYLFENQIINCCCFDLIISKMNLPRFVISLILLVDSCDEGEFKCSTVDGCSDASYLCDGERDCTDGSDERICGMYRLYHGCFSPPRIIRCQFLSC